MQYFFDNAINISDKLFTLEAEESKHAVKVLRHSKGDVLNILNGRGGKFRAQILETNPKGCEMQVIDFSEEVRQAPNIQIALALLKNRDRMEWFVEKAVEIGASELSFFTSHYAEKKGLNMERIHKIAISALKQSGNTWLPTLNPLIHFEKLVNQEYNGMKFIGYCPVDTNEHLKGRCIPGNDAIMLIGPEGDFTEPEVSVAKEAGFVEVSLGKNRFRAETAALVSLLILRLGNV
jgi:16S rRNA (uracil1498-N3)-methyltransferase